MKSENKYWKIECWQQLEIKFRKKVNTKHLSEKNLIEFIKILMSKYALSDDEILEQQLRTPKDYINIKRSNNKFGERVDINFLTETVGGIYVHVSLTE